MKIYILIGIILTTKSNHLHAAAQGHTLKNKLKPEVTELIISDLIQDSPRCSPLDAPGRETESPMIITQILNQAITLSPSTSDIAIIMSPRKKPSRNPYTNSPSRKAALLAMSPEMSRQVRSHFIKSPEIIAVCNQASTTWQTLKNNSFSPSHPRLVANRLPKSPCPIALRSHRKRQKQIWEKAIQPLRQEKIDLAVQNWNQYVESNLT